MGKNTHDSNKERLLKKKEQEAEQKIKSGKKLTTEDFLVFQKH